MTAAAFGIVTPFPGTEFYEELDSKGLIFEKNWDNFDEMHNVYKTNFLSKEKIEELATFCMAKFWNIDTFLDREKVFQRRTKRKTNLMHFIQERVIDAKFLGKAGSSLKKEDFGRNAKLFLNAYADPRVEEYTKKEGVHNILEMTRFLKILGTQKIQCSFNLDKDAKVSLILKTDKKKVEYIKIIKGRENPTTIDFDVNLKWIDNPGHENKVEILRTVMKRNWNIKSLLGIFRFFTAFGTEYLAWKIQK
jgi:hypothetical protein